MKILVVGAGVIGSLYGWALARGGHDVVHLVRPGRASKYADGLVLDVLDKRPGQPRWFRGVYALATVESAEAALDAELLVVPGHHFALHEVLSEVVPRFPGATVLFLTQNWEGTRALEDAVPANRCVLGDAKAGGCWEQGVLKGALQSLDLGPVSPADSAAAEQVAGVFRRARIPVILQKKMVEYLWVQFAMTGALWPSLVEAGSFPALLNNRKAGEKALDAMAECLGLLEKRGVRLGDYPETRPYLFQSPFLRFLLFQGLRAVFTWSEFMKRTSAHALGDRAEILAFYRDIQSTARALEHPMPVFNSYSPCIERFAGDGLHSAG